MTGRQDIRRAGFSIIEILVVMAIIALLVGAGMAATSRFNRNQQQRLEAERVGTALRRLQKTADASEVLGTPCTDNFEGYKVLVTEGATEAQVFQRCNGFDELLTHETIVLGSGLTFAVTDPPAALIFKPVSGGIEITDNTGSLLQKSIRVVWDNGDTSDIMVNTQGLIEVVQP